MRPTPHDVHDWFARCGTIAMAAACLTTLHADPNWRIRHTRGVALHTFSLLYSPTGECIEVVLLRVGTLYYPHVATYDVATDAAAG